MALFDLKTLLSDNSYPGRGIVIGQSEDGEYAMFAYFIMGRSVNSRNRIFEQFDGGMRTKAYDESKLVDPSLIIYNPVLTYKTNEDYIDVVTNGDQTDTIYRFLQEGKSFEEALMTREFEPDAPNFTPRISGILNYGRNQNDFSYELSILKSANGDPSVCNRFFYRYLPRPGIGHFIHTYSCDGDPIPSFMGEPEEVSLPNSPEELRDLIWNHLNLDNKVSLYVSAVSLKDHSVKTLLVNKNQ